MILAISVVHILPDTEGKYEEWIANETIEAAKEGVEWHPSGIPLPNMLFVLGFLIMLCMD